MEALEYEFLTFPFEAVAVGCAFHSTRALDPITIITLLFYGLHRRL